LTKFEKKELRAVSSAASTTEGPSDGDDDDNDNDDDDPTMTQKCSMKSAEYNDVIFNTNGSVLIIL
jgi:hypothetical protein